jgi:amino acid adenylation domain-containing protein
MMAAPGALPPLLAALDAHAAQRPEHLALRAGNQAVTYSDLRERVLAVARGLMARDVLPGERIGVMGDKTIDAVVALLAVLRAGATYVPIDPHAPTLRWSQLLGDASCRLLLCAGDVGVVAGRLAEVTAACTGTGTAVADISVQSVARLAAGDGPQPPDRIEPDAVAYCMYTSGSTGLPKGVQITHRSISAFFRAVHPILGADENSRCLNTSNLHFDVSVVDLLYPLYCGATVVITPAIPLPPLLVGLLERERITHLAAVGSTMRLLAEHSDGFRGRDLTALRRLMTGAEVIDPWAVQQWLAAAPDLKVVNGYGPTEATCLVLAEVIDRREPGRTRPYPIGRPLAGVTLRFLDASGTASTAGPGEIAVSGDQVMLGYLNRPQEQQRAFVDLAGVRYYRTGDLGRLRPDGSVDYLGRGDDEIKHRGYRINLQEVRRTIEQHAQVGRAFVVQVADARGRSALGCAVLAPHAEQTSAAGVWQLREMPVEQAAELQAHLESYLPAYMRPEHIRVLTALPMLSTGKPDTAGVVAALRRSCAQQEVEAV